MWRVALFFAYSYVAVVVSAATVATFRPQWAGRSLCVALAYAVLTVLVLVAEDRYGP